jgi:uncharacterized protein (TIGR04255 family)
MQTRHMGQFWGEHQAEYPTSEDLAPLLDLADIEPQRLIVMESPPLRRMMCYSADKQYVAQIQDSRVHLNWRKLIPENQYPRYPQVHDKYQRLWQEFQNFIKREQVGEISPSRFELTYYNHIELGRDVAASLEQHIKLFRFSPIQASYLSPPESVNIVWKFAMPNQMGTGTVTLTNGTNQQGQNLLLLNLTCAGTPSEKYKEADWYEAAHEWIVRSFTELTTDQAHQKWGREK